MNSCPSSQVWFNWRNWLLFFVRFLLVAVILPTSVLHAKSIGVMWMGKSGMTIRVVQGFSARVQQLAPGLEIEYQKEIVDRRSAEAIFSRFNNQKDALVFLRSSGARFLASHSLKVPAFIGGCNNPELLGVITKLEGRPDKNITGVTYFLSPVKQFFLFKALFPHLKKVCLLLEKGHPGSYIDQKGTLQAGNLFGIDVQVVYNSSKHELVQNVMRNKKAVDLFILGSEALLMDNAGLIVESAGRTAVVAYSKKAIENGALAGYVADDVKLGRMLAESVFEVLYNNQKIRDTPIKMDSEPKLIINRRTLKHTPLELPENIAKRAVYLGDTH